ncbi:MAG: cupin domain-containing protein [Pseudomonadota bacterium]
MTMTLVRHDDAPPYEAPGHSGMQMRRLQGMDASATDAMWMGLNRIAPHGHTDLKASEAEKIYLVLQGEVTFGDGERSVTAGPLDSVHFARSAPRRLENRGDREALVVLIMERR